MIVNVAIILHSAIQKEVSFKGLLIKLKCKCEQGTWTSISISISIVRSVSIVYCLIKEEKNREEYTIQPKNKCITLLVLALTFCLSVPNIPIQPFFFSSLLKTYVLTSLNTSTSVSSDCYIDSFSYSL